MNLKELREIIDIFDSTGSIEELELERSGVRLRIKRASGNGATVSLAPASSAHILAPVPSAQHAPPEAPQEAETGIYYIKSPIVGTFYKAASPSSEAFVSLGDFVEKGAVVCIIEAMKLMNEIESDVAGEIVNILVENGQPVEY